MVLRKWSVFWMQSERPRKCFALSKVRIASFRLLGKTLLQPKTMERSRRLWRKYKIYQSACWPRQWLLCGSSFSGQMIFWLAEVWESYLVQAHSECPFAVLRALVGNHICSRPGVQPSVSELWTPSNPLCSSVTQAHVNHCKECVGHCLDLRLGLFFLSSHPGPYLASASM